MSAGLCFKLAAVPFHFYAPDVYQGATAGNAALLAVIPKAAGVLAFTRLVVAIFPAYATAWQMAVIVAILTCTTLGPLQKWFGSALGEILNQTSRFALAILGTYFVLRLHDQTKNSTSE